MHLKETGQEGVGKNHLAEYGDQWWNIVNILMKNLRVFFFFFKCKEILYMLGNCSFSRDLVCVTEWQVDRLIGSFFLVVVNIEHARFEIDLAVFKSSGMLQYGNSK